MGKGRSKGSGVLEIRVEGRRFREVVQVFESGWMSRDVFFVRRFQKGNLYSTRVRSSGRASGDMLESHVPFQGKALRHDLCRCRPRGRSLERLLASQ